MAMRIAYLFMKYPMGVQPYAISDVRALEALGYRVDVYALSGTSRDHERAVAAYSMTFQPGAHAGWRTLLAPLDPRNLDMTLFLIGFILRRLPFRPREFATALALTPRLIEVAAILRRDPPDVMHAFWGHYPSLMLALAERFFPAVHRSMALTAYDITSHLFSQSGPISAGAHSIWTLADENLALLKAIGAPMDRVHVVYRGIPIDLADSPAPEKEPGLICTAANFQKEKNIHLVLRAFAVVRAQAPHVRLMVMGDGQERAALEALAADLKLGDAVVFTGLLPREELFAIMRRSEVFLFLSTKVSERLPNAVMEGMLAEAVCVVSRTSGIETLIEHGISGFIEDDLDPAIVAERVLGVLADPARGRAGAKAAAHIRSRFSAKAAMRAYADAWQAEVAARRPQ